MKIAKILNELIDKRVTIYYVDRLNNDPTNKGILLDFDDDWLKINSDHVNAPFILINRSQIETIVPFEEVTA